MADMQSPAALATPTTPIACYPFMDLRMAGLACGILAILPYALPRFQLAAQVGSEPFPWSAERLLVGSLWGGILAATPALACRRPRLAVTLFVGGWACAFLGAWFWNPREILQPALVDATFLLGLPRSHLMFTLDGLARLTETPLSLALVIGLAHAGIGASTGRTLLAVALASLAIPIFWFASALFQQVIVVRGVMVHTLNFLLLLAHFALWGVVPWATLSRVHRDRLAGGSA